MPTDGRATPQKGVRRAAESDLTSALARVRHALSGAGETPADELYHAVTAYARAARSSRRRCDRTIARLKEELLARGHGDRYRELALFQAIVSWCVDAYSNHHTDHHGGGAHGSSVMRQARALCARVRPMLARLASAELDDLAPETSTE